MTGVDAEHEPYLSFYGRHKISPVRQDVSNLERHYQRRAHLYRLLGIPDFALAGKSVIEFGPGSGYNALFTTHLRPGRYVLVDGNRTGFEQSQQLLQRSHPDYTRHEFVFSRIQDFRTDEKFDVVFCEGVIPHQKDPATFVRHVGSFARPGGVIVITTADYVSVFAEVLRRVICDALVPAQRPFDERVAKLVPVFEPHYASLANASRPIEDWLIDTLLDEWRNPLFSMAAAIEALDGAFEVYGGSPRIFTEWRWYKELDAVNARVNERAIAEYRANYLSLIDSRAVLPPQPPEVTGPIAALCERAYWAMIKVRFSDAPDFSETIEICEAMALQVATIAPNVANSVTEVARFLRSPSAVDPKTAFPSFALLFGRGQQYLSFIKV